MGASLHGEQMVLRALISGVGPLYWWELQVDLSSEGTPFSLGFFSLVWLLKSKLNTSLEPETQTKLWAPKISGSTTRSWSRKQNWYVDSSLKANGGEWSRSKAASGPDFWFPPEHIKYKKRRTKNTCFLSRRKVNQHTTLILNFPFPQTCKELSVVQIRGVPDSEGMFYVFFFSLENFFWFSEDVSVEQLSDDSTWANNTDTQAMDISK